MGKRIRWLKIVALTVMLLTLMVSVSACFGSCKDDDFVAGEVWRYLKLNDGKDGIALTGLSDDSYLVDGVLMIPTEVDGYKVVCLTGRDTRNWAGGGGIFDFQTLDAHKIIIPNGIYVERLFWGERTPLFVEFLAEIPDERSYLVSGLFRWDEQRTYVVPNGTAHLYLNSLTGEIYQSLRIIEKSEYLQEINNVE